MKWAIPGLSGIDANFEAMTRRIFPDSVAGALLGFFVGYMATNSVSYVGFDTPRLLSLAVGMFVAIGGYGLGVLRQGPPGRGKAVGWWCATMLVGLGAASFVIGFIGCMLFIPGTNSPLLAFFVIGPWGAVLGAASGVVTGLVVGNPGTNSASVQT